MIAQYLPITEVSHEVAGGNTPAPPVQAGATQALSNATVANVAGKDVKGYGLDFNNNGQFDRNDGVLAFDSDNNGQISAREIDQSRAALDAFSGNDDLNHDGKTDFFEKKIAQGMREKFGEKYDKNHDGQLDPNELQAGGARVLTDANGDGKFEVNNANRVNVNTPGGPGVGQVTGVGGGLTGLAPAAPPPMPMQPALG